ncbi:hypothetical protein ID866_12965 [Astraeus odoratus]|nr:hypothetical protein ID866_12965 [Astraeus odoratus]
MPDRATKLWMHSTGFSTIWTTTHCMRKAHKGSVPYYSMPHEYAKTGTTSSL